LDLVARVLIERGDDVAIEDPQYQGAREIFRSAGARLQLVSVDREGLNPDKLPKRARLAFVTPSHQFPTGAILPLARRLALLEWARHKNAVIVEDDYDGEFHYEGQPLESLQGLDGEGRVIYIGTFSRTVFSALRIGYLIAPKSLVPAFTSAKWLCDRHTATLEQETLAEFIATGMYERHLRRIRRRNTANREALLGAVEEYLGGRVQVSGRRRNACGALAAWPRLGRGGDRKSGDCRSGDLRDIRIFPDADRESGLYVGLLTPEGTRNSRRDTATERSAVSSTAERENRPPRICG
jgi:GntR family transcriptional regulator/MocR family aminotransferase